MTETKRFRLGYVCGDYGLIDNDEWIDFHSMSENSEKNVKICINKMNELADENEQLKQFKEKVFTWIDKEIARNEEAIEWGKETGVDSGSIEFYNHMLYRLKKELKE